MTAPSPPPLNPWDLNRGAAAPQALSYMVPNQRPGVVPWFVAYAVLMTLLYLLVLGLGVMMLAMGPEQFADAQDGPEAVRVQAWILSVIGAPLAVAFGIAPLLPRRRWVWIYDLVLICIGLTSLCLLPATIPLLIFWIKPHTRAWFDPEARPLIDAPAA